MKEFLQRELAELKQNKIRTGALVACLVILLIFWASDYISTDEEIIPTATPPVTKDFPVKSLPAEKSPDGVTTVLGANADALFIDDPFAGKKKPQLQPPQSLPKIPDAPVKPAVIQPPPAPKVEPPEKIILTGTAISGENKTAMFLRGKETLFLTVGEEIGGRRIADITPDCVVFDDGGRAELQKELN